MNMVNYGIRYSNGEDNKVYNFKNNYGAWIPNNKLKCFIIEDERINCKGHHLHEFIPKDYVPKVK